MRDCLQSRLDWWGRLCGVRPAADVGMESAPFQYPEVRCRHWFSAERAARWLAG